MNVLLVEDNDDDAVVIEEELSHSLHVNIDLARSVSLSTMERALEAASFDVVLLDLGLPDGQGLDTLRRFQKTTPDLPVVVLTGADDQELALAALREGAQDYLVKGIGSIDLIARSLRYAIERRELQRQIDLSRRQRAQEAEQQEEASQKEFLQDFGLTHQQMAGPKSPDSEGPEIGDLVEDYAKVLVLYVRAIRTRSPKPTEELARLTRRIATERGFARDVAQLHLQALMRIEDSVLPVGVHEFQKDARLVLVEALGRLLDHYRLLTGT